MSPPKCYSVDKGQADDLFTDGNMCAFQGGASGHSASPKHVRVLVREGVVVEGTEEIPWGLRKLKSQDAEKPRGSWRPRFSGREDRGLQRDHIYECPQDQRSD